MRWTAVALVTTIAAAAIVWALVTTGHWPLDDRAQPAAAFYALNGALGRWLLDHGGEVPAAPDRAGVPGAPGSRGDLAAPAGLTPAEVLAAQQALRADSRFRDRYRFTPAPAGGSAGRG